MPLEAPESGKVEVVETGSFKVAPSMPRAIQELRERGVVQGVPAGVRERGGTGVGTGPSRGRGYNGFGDWRLDGGRVPSWGALRGTNEGFDAHGRERGRSRE